jgi:hypothetical protein
MVGNFKQENLRDWKPVSWALSFAVILHIGNHALLESLRATVKGSEKGH